MEKGGMRTEFENRIYIRAELREREIDTNDFTFMDEVGEVEGTLCLKAAPVLCSFGWSKDPDAGVLVAAKRGLS